MGLFNTILQKLGLAKPAASTPTPASTAATVAPAVATAPAAAPTAAPYRPISSPPAPTTVAPAAPAVPTVSTVFSPTVAPAAPAVLPVAAPAHPAAISVVDVVSKLEGLAGSHPGLNWKVSIVDLLKLLEIDSDFESRKSLAIELGCPANLMNDSASMNVWLHKTVLQKIAENGGNIPASLLD